MKSKGTEKKTPPKTGQENIPSATKEYSFFQDVYDVVRQIPKGRVTSYGAIANYLGTKLSARMVGWAMNAAGSAKPKVPAHRVVNRNGLLSGKAHFSPPELMEQLLAKEKVLVSGDKIVDFKKKLVLGSGHCAETLGSRDEHHMDIETNQHLYFALKIKHGY